ncbi:MAG: 50S ribosomal protein L9 [Proteobacteria bacterium]|jgi:large subunit ribosomal protein L9|uniref:Large ribosomal subunit protein bL9 n=1 Tax=SAR92 bacterium BACL26 MAG-121220-bin70 TaxID=1655626 RepID=A0A0R2U8J9_9GAMM|nr:MAG: 50S ribosomal protein L9 [SAR92 bacterium BACL26 MAG-121220-bin70]MDA0794924.1 50S ribosomal protein L9 [Pseudomonadota bacterium]MDA1350917.1 50S ribosomal protein L9 [Pseudomonadota bacterium]|tara:strand:- start:7898 stop:8347 length:450 start_codon:yes stop_codon:yes gene_type:complete
MQVILLEKIGNIGNIGDRANVKAGFGRNYLIPQGKAVFATDKNIAEFELRRAGLEARAADKLGEAQIRADKLKAVGVITISAIAGDEGKLFGSVGARELEEAIVAAGGDVTKNEISLPEGPLRHVGEFNVEVQLHADITETMTVVIEAA